jgi:HEAT repeat protein
MANMRTKVICSLAVWLSPCYLLSLSFGPAGTARAYERVIDSPMYKDPKIPMPHVVVVYVDSKALWLKALKRPEADLKCQVAEAIARAHRRGEKVRRATTGPLLAVFNQPDQNPTVRLAVARTLITLGAKAAAPSLFRQAQKGTADLAALVEPALARWDYRPARAAWLRRLRQSGVSYGNLVLAIRGLGQVGEAKAGDRLRTLVLSERLPGSLRLEAARALARLRSRGLEKDAAALAGQASARGIPARLAAAALLRRHRSRAAVRTLQRLAGDPEPAVAAPAVEHLLRIDHKLLLPALKHLLASSDPRLRMAAVTVLRRESSARHVRLLGDRLTDPDPDVRRQARQYLEELASNKEYKKQILDLASRVLAGEKWQGLEQATILLTRLKHEAAATRLVKLLTFDRPEVFVTAAWGLRKLAVRKTLPAVKDYVGKREKQVRAAVGRLPLDFDAADHQLSQLNQLLGRERYAPASAVLRQFLPRMEKPMQGGICPECRAAAIWALGMIHEGEADLKLALALEGRLNDISAPPPEDPRVRVMSAVTLARMEALNSLPTLRKHYRAKKPTLDPVNNACGWAVEQLTGERMPAPKTIRRRRRDWVLTPSK